MSNYSPKEEIGFVAVIVLLCGFSFVCGTSFAESKHKLEMVKRGFAEWIVDKERNVQFVWKEAKP